MLLAGDSGTSSAITPGSSLMRHPDRGAGYYFQRRERYGRASLVETGRCAPWATGTLQSQEHHFLVITKIWSCACVASSPAVFTFLRCLLTGTLKHQAKAFTHLFKHLFPNT